MTTTTALPPTAAELAATAAFADIFDDMLWAAYRDGTRLRQGFEADAVAGEANRLIRDAVTPFYLRALELIEPGAEVPGLADTMRNLYRQGLRGSWKEPISEPPADL